MSNLVSGKSYILRHGSVFVQINYLFDSYSQKIVHRKYLHMVKWSETFHIKGY